MFIDTHCHIQMVLEENKWTLQDFFGEAEAHKVHKVIHIGTSLEDSRHGQETFHLDPRIALSAGVHPCEIKKLLSYQSDPSQSKDQLYSLLISPLCCAVGETGLDFTNQTTDQEKQQQIEWFFMQAHWAKQLQKTLIIHCRNAFEECFSILKEVQTTSGVVFHCFTGDKTIAQKALDLDCMLSFSGILTFKNADAIRTSARFAPQDRIVLETDAPFLAPVPFRKSTNHSGRLVVTAQCLAELRDTSLENVSFFTTKNAEKLFPLAHNPT